MLLTTTQAAERLGISRYRVHQLITAGRLAAQKFGPVYQIEETAVEALRDRPRAWRQHDRPQSSVQQ